MKKCGLLITLLTLVFILYFVRPGFSQTPEDLGIIKEEIRLLKERQIAIQKEIKEIKNRIGRRPKPAEFKEAIIDIHDVPFKGDKNAEVVLIEFSDYQ